MRLATVFKFRLSQVAVLHYPGSEQQRRWLDCADAQADLCLCCSHTAKIGFLMMWLISDLIFIINLVIHVFILLSEMCVLDAFLFWNIEYALCSTLLMKCVCEPPHGKTNNMACAPSEDSDPPSLISLHCPHGEALGPWPSLERIAKTDQTGQLPRLICVFTGPTGNIIVFVMLRLKYWFCYFVMLEILSLLFVRKNQKQTWRKIKLFFWNVRLLEFPVPIASCQSKFTLTSQMRLKLGTIKWAATWQNHRSECAPSEDSDQPGHPPSLIRVLAVRMKKPWVLSYPLSAQLRLIRLGGCPGWSESSLGAHSFCWFCHVLAQICMFFVLVWFDFCFMALQHIFGHFRCSQIP